MSASGSIVGPSVWCQPQRTGYGASQKKLITFCFNSRAEGARVDDFGLLLSVVENTADAEDVLAAEDGDQSNLLDTDCDD
jgi:hypothetical protein